MIKSLLVILLSALVATVSAAIHRVDVGEDGLKFTPDSLRAARGDKIEFFFHPGGHSVAHSLYKKACQPTPHSFFSGYFTQKSGIADQKFTIEVNNTAPMFIYCPSFHHCNAGMSMVVNPGRGESMKSFKLRSRLALKIGTPENVGGGTFSPSS